MLDRGIHRPHSCSDDHETDSRRQITWNQRYELKESLNHGKNILQTEDQLAAYLSWYGEMHKVKCNIAAQNFPYQELGMRIHIVDWGCGQAIASLCFMESLEQRGLLSYNGDFLRYHSSFMVGLFAFDFVCSAA